MHSSQRLFLALSPLLSLVSANTFYVQSDIYQGETFFNQFDFFTDVDPTGGYVDYKSQADAETLGLISANSKSARWGVGQAPIDPADTTIRGRPSVRLEGKRAYTKGLFVADIAHMPGNACGMWPAFWTLGSGTWPLNGEIDIIEGVNELTTNKASLHSGDTTCAINSAPQTGSIASTDCQTTHNGVMDNFVGCGINSGSNTGFGSPFNAGGGGTYAMQWTDTFIKTWFFPRGHEPPSLSCSAPDVNEFGLPDSFFSGCDIGSNFKENRLVFTTTFCGSWAGANGVYNTAGCPLAFPDDEGQSCRTQVATNPQTFEQGFWEVNSIKIFSETSTPQSCSSSSSSSSSVASSTSSSASSSASSASSSSSSSSGSSSSSATSSVSSGSSSSLSSATSSASSGSSSSLSSATSSASSGSSSSLSSATSSDFSASSSSLSSATFSASSDSSSATSSPASSYSSTYSTSSYSSGHYTNSSSTAISTTSYSSDYYPSSATASKTSSVNYYDPYYSSSASSSSVNYYDPYEPSSKKSSSSAKSTTSSYVYGYDWDASTTSSTKYTSSSSFVSYPPITTCTYPAGFQPIKAVIKSVIVTDYVYGSMTSKVTKTGTYCAMCHYTETSKTPIKVATSSKSSLYLSANTIKYNSKVQTVTVKKSSSTPGAPVKAKTSTSDCGTVTSVITVKGTKSSPVAVPSYPAKVNGTSSYPVKAVVSTSSYPAKAVVTPPAVYNGNGTTTPYKSSGNSTSYSPLQVTKNAAGKNVAGGLALMGAVIVAAMML